MFNCSKCGRCCRHIGGIELFKDMDGGAGICKYLNQESNLCEIYNTRPVFCNVDAMYDLLFKDKSSMTREEFYELNYKACEEIYNL